jgi:acetolactate synthase-1/2/3 large subunit
MKLAEGLVRCLEHEGVQYIFGLPGEENMAILDALIDSSITFITVHHEQGAAFMADVYGRLTGRAGVCLSTLGPGATNLITGVADAFLDRAPMVALTGQVSRDRMHKESHQHLDIVSIFHPITKWNTLLQKPEIVPEVVRKAFKIAEQEKPGPTHIDIPEDVANMEIDCEPLFRKETHEPEPKDSTLREALALIHNARFPLVLAGNGVVRARASNALCRFAEKFEIPVSNTFMGKGVIPFDHPLSLMSVGLQARDYISCGFERADLVIAIGYDMVEYHPELWNHNKDKKIMHIDQSPAEVDASYVPSVEVLGDIGNSLDRMIEMGRAREGTPGVRILREFIMKEIEENRDDTSFPLKPQKIIGDLRDALGRKDIVISDVGAHKLWIARMFPCYHPNTCLISNGFASMGIALPGAMSAKMVHPEHKVVAVTGDGGFLMNVQELETAVRVGNPLVVLVLTDQGYGMIRWKQLMHYGRAFAVDWGPVDFKMLAESFGARGYRVEAAQELRPILNDALTTNQVSVIQCPVDFNENIRLTDHLGHLVCPI